VRACADDICFCLRCARDAPYDVTPFDARDIFAVYASPRAARAQVRSARARRVRFMLIAIDYDDDYYFCTDCLISFHFAFAA